MKYFEGASFGVVVSLVCFAALRLVSTAQALQQKSDCYIMQSDARVYHKYALTFDEFVQCEDVGVFIGDNVLIYE